MEIDYFVSQQLSCSLTCPYSSNYEEFRFRFSEAKFCCRDVSEWGEGGMGAG